MGNKESGEMDLAGVLGSLKDKKGKPVLEVRANVYSDGGMMPDKNWSKEEHKRLKGDVKAIEDQLGNWDDADVSAKAKKSLQRELASKKARLMETEALMEE